MNTLISGGLPKELAEDLRELRLEIVPKGFVAAMEVQSTLLGKIHEAQKDDKEIAEIKERMSKGKANVVVDALSRKSYVKTLVSGELLKDLVEDLRELHLEIVPSGFVATLEVQSTLLEKIREAQKDDKEIAEIKEKMSEGKAKWFHEDEQDTLWFEDRIYVPNNAEIRKLILQEAHESPYSIHPRNTKMYLDLKELSGGLV